MDRSINHYENRRHTIKILTFPNDGISKLEPNTKFQLSKTQTCVGKCVSLQRNINIYQQT